MCQYSSFLPVYFPILPICHSRVSVSRQESRSNANLKRVWVGVGWVGWVGGVGGVEEWTLRLNSAQFQLKLPTRAELGNNY